MPYCFFSPLIYSLRSLAFIHKETYVPRPQRWCTTIQIRLPLFLFPMPAHSCKPVKTDIGTDVKQTCPTTLCPSVYSNDPKIAQSVNYIQKKCYLIYNSICIIYKLMLTIKELHRAITTSQCTTMQWCSIAQFSQSSVMHVTPATLVGLDKPCGLFTAALHKLSKVCWSADVLPVIRMIRNVYRAMSLHGKASECSSKPTVKCPPG